MKIKSTFSYAILLLVLILPFSMPVQASVWGWIKSFFDGSRTCQWSGDYNWTTTEVTIGCKINLRRIGDPNPGVKTVKYNSINQFLKDSEVPRAVNQMVSANLNSSKSKINPEKPITIKLKLEYGKGLAPKYELRPKKRGE